MSAGEPTGSGAAGDRAARGAGEAPAGGTRGPGEPGPRVLLLHNRYRLRGGEERAVELQVEAMARAGIEHRVLYRDSADAGSARAARAMLRGGEDEQDVADAVREFGADVVHVHNMNPLFGPRALTAARTAGARVILHLHNFRLFCSIATCFRDGAPCFRCRGRFTLPAVALNCRGSLPESAVYATALAVHQPDVLDAVDRFVTPSEYARGQLATLGLPPERVTVLPNYVTGFAERSKAGEGEYAVAFGRLSAEKGFDVAIEAARISGVALKIAGDGPLAAELRARTASITGRVELLGRLDPSRLAALLEGAAMAVVPSLGGDVMPYAALEAMAAGLPVIASDSGSLPEIVGAERCVPRGDPAALAEVVAALHADPDHRRAEGEAALARTRERFGESRYMRDLTSLYTSVG
jgi:glycosyltransferase involved in cell wall biosynthesis